MDEARFRDYLAEGGYGEPKITEWEANLVNDSHSHDFGAAILVLSGSLTVTTADGTTTCGADDTVSLDAGVPHTEVVGADGVRFLSGRR